MDELGLCNIDGCGKVAWRREMCSEHYHRWRRNGDPLKRLRVRKGEALEWLRQSVEYQGDDCLIWPFSRANDGYGRVFFEGKKSTSSRVMCVLAHGRPPTPRHQAAHSCGKGHLGCVSPRHLRWATCSENQSERVPHGTSNRGERQHLSTLSESEVKAIHAEKATTSARLLAGRYGVSEATIYNIWAGRSWGWLI